MYILSTNRKGIFMKKMTYLLITFFVAGCSTNPSTNVNKSSEPIEVSVDVLPQYWKVDFETYSFSSEYDGEFKPRPAGYVKIRYLIDSNGNPTHLNVVESHPAGVWNDQGLLAAEQLQYSPSKKNKTNAPVYVTTEFHFKEIK